MKKLSFLFLTVLLVGSANCFAEPTDQDPISALGTGTEIQVNRALNFPGSCDPAIWFRDGQGPLSQLVNDDAPFTCSINLQNDLDANIVSYDRELAANTNAAGETITIAMLKESLGTAVSIHLAKPVLVH